MTPPSADGPSLSAVIHDSDVVILNVQPASAGSGVAYLHQTVRSFFDDDTIGPADKPAGVEYLSAWLRAYWPPAAALPALEQVLSAHLVDDAHVPDGDEVLAEDSLLAFLDTLAIPRPPSR